MPVHYFKNLCWVATVDVERITAVATIGVVRWVGWGGGGGGGGGGDSLTPDLPN